MDGVTASKAAVCKSGFVNGGTCYTPSGYKNTAGTALRQDPYTCDVSASDTCGVYEETLTTVINDVACNCEHGTNRT